MHVRGGREKENGFARGVGGGLLGEGAKVEKWLHARSVPWLTPTSPSLLCDTARLRFSEHGISRPVHQPEMPTRVRDLCNKI